MYPNSKLGARLRLCVPLTCPETFLHVNDRVWIQLARAEDGVGRDQETGVFALGTFAGSAGEPFPGLVVGGRVVDLRPHFGSDATTSGMLAVWDESLQRLRALAAD